MRLRVDFEMPDFCSSGADVNVGPDGDCALSDNRLSGRDGEDGGEEGCSVGECSKAEIHWHTVICILVVVDGNPVRGLNAGLASGGWVGIGETERRST